MRARIPRATPGVPAALVALVALLLASPVARLAAQNPRPDSLAKRDSLLRQRDSVALRDLLQKRDSLLDALHRRDSVARADSLARAAAAARSRRPAARSDSALRADSLARARAGRFPYVVLLPPQLLGAPIAYPSSPLLPKLIGADTLLAQAGAGPPGTDTIPRRPPSIPRRNPFGVDFPVDLRARLESKAEQTRNERCTSSQLYAPISSCRGGLQPSFGVQFALRSNGVVGDRIHVGVDYDTQREFDASNSVSAAYVGDPGDRLERFELGNVSFVPPVSRFVTASVPSGNYGLQVVGRAGPLRLRAIAAQQKGNLVRSRVYNVGGDQITQGNEREIQDFQIESRRFFFTIDPQNLAGYPNVDILDATGLARARSQLPDTLRPTRVTLYRLQFGAPPQNPNAPRFRVLDLPGSGRQTYDVLREGVDYYMDPSLLWFALSRPLNASSERLVVAYTVRLNGKDTTWISTGGTPDLQATTADQAAGLVWDPSVDPTMPAFRKEIRSAYRVAGPELQRRTVRVRVVAGVADQERPVQPTFAGRTYDSYLHMLGVAQANNTSAFDASTHLWPREGDPVFGLGAGSAGSPLATGTVSGAAASGNGVGTASAGAVIGDYYLIFPSLRPFALRDSGLVAPGNASNEAIYTTLPEYLYSTRHPPAVYRIRLGYETQGNGSTGALDLGVVQLRQGSERIEVDGRRLVRDVDYHIDYDVGRVTFTRPDTLFTAPRSVTVAYEENPLFVAAPTSLFGLVSELPLPHGGFAFTAISQSQRTTFAHPQLGFEPASSLIGGVTGGFAWDAPGLTRMLSHLPFGTAASGKSRIAILGEVAASKPNAAARDAEAYLETFEGEGGVPISLADPQWAYSSLPAYGTTLRARFGGLLEERNAVTMAWQSNGIASDGRPAVVHYGDIDSLSTFAGAAADFAAPEPLLWLTLYPKAIGGRLDPSSNRFQWTIGGAAPGSRRFRSIRTVLSPTGVDLTTSEYLEFWTLIDTTAAVRSRNPTLVFDFGDVSENRVAFAPESLFIRRGAGGVIDSLFTGRRTVGVDSLDSERDPFSRAFDVGRNDTGLPGDVADTLVVVDSTAGTVTARRATNVPICLAAPGALQRLGDTRTDCTRGNWRLDEEDIDQDGALNLTTSRREEERILRLVVDLADPKSIVRLGRTAVVHDTAGGIPTDRFLQWALVRVPFTQADSIGAVQRRRIKALRLTMISGAGLPDDQFTLLPLARVKVSGAPWLKRASTTLAGIGGERPASGFTLAGLIGTADRDLAHGIDYESPPGVGQGPDSRAQLQSGVTQINERSLRLVAGGLAPFGRAEAYYRFPNGEQNLMSYRELRLWARGRGNGWGQSGELQMFVRIGRDENDFYLYRTPVSGGDGQGAWLPEVRVDFARLFALRQRVQNAYLAGSADTLAGCSSIDSALVRQSAPPVAGSRRYVACDGGYMVYSADPGVHPPNLAGVQELAVGIVRVGAGTGPAPVLPGDTLELWVDDIRLGRPANSVGWAGQLGVELSAGGLVDFRVVASRRDGNFRQLSERPSFLDDDAVELSSTLHLEKLLPGFGGFALPLTVTHSSSRSEPLFLSETDIPGRGLSGLRTPRTAQTTWTLAIHRTAGFGNPLLSALVAPLALVSSYTTGGDRAEYHDGGSHRFTVGLDWVTTGDTARTFVAPPWLRRIASVLPSAVGARRQAAGGPGAIRWNPTQLRLTSGLVNGTDRRFNFLKPAEALDDVPRLALSMTQLWRSGATVELQPVSALTARVDFSSIRDLRQYGDTNAAARLATDARRGGGWGPFAGFERERTMQTSVAFAPGWGGWLRPHADFSTEYAMLRDPNASYPSLDSLALQSLPRRVNATQTIGTGALLDLGVAASGLGMDSAGARRLGTVVGPVDVSLTRTLSSALDAAQYSPTAAFQLGLYDIGGFRWPNGADPASTVGATTTLGASQSIGLPLGFTVLHRFRRTATQNWAQRVTGDGSGQARVDGAQTVFPDVSLRWLWRPVGLRDVLNAVSATAGFANTAAFSTLPGALDAGDQLRRSRVRSWPVTASFAFADGVGPNAAVGYTLTQRLDSLPGSLGHGTGRDLNVDLSQRFRLPRSLPLLFHNDIRARVGFQRGRSEMFVADALGGAAARSSRVLDQGRTAFNLGADTELSRAVQFTLQGSRIITFDNNLNRRLSQFVLSTVLQIDFGALQR